MCSSRKVYYIFFISVNTCIFYQLKLKIVLRIPALNESKIETNISAGRELSSNDLQENNTFLICNVVCEHLVIIIMISVQDACFISLFF